MVATQGYDDFWRGMIHGWIGRGLLFKPIRGQEHLRLGSFKLQLNCWMERRSVDWYLMMYVYIST